MVSYLGVSLYRLHVPSAFGRRAGFDMDAKSGLSSGCASSYHLDEGMHGDGMQHNQSSEKCKLKKRERDTLQTYWSN